MGKSNQLFGYGHDELLDQPIERLIRQRFHHGHLPYRREYLAAPEPRTGSHSSGRHIPIIAMTAGAFAEDRQRCTDAGMDDYLTKPIDPDELRSAVGRWTGEPAAEAPRNDG